MLDIAEITNWNEYVRIFVTLFAMVSPPIIFPLFLGAVGDRPKAQQLVVATVGSFSYLIVMLLFVFFGKEILYLFGISISAFRVAGGLLLLLMSLEMMRSEPSIGGKAESDSTAGAFALGVVPLAMPILAGPGTLSTLVVFANIHDSLSHKFVVAVVVVVLFVYLMIALRLTVYSGKLMTKTATVVFYRIMGLLIGAIAVEFIIHGIAEHFPALEISEF
ncbi:MAG: NAAT family transporter [Gammaproteobacteria bacterium]|nr:NAAT family transporter [Gammaproteobacteria bacterium]